jgi:hypothetical protein
MNEKVILLVEDDPKDEALTLRALEKIPNARLEKPFDVGSRRFVVQSLLR